MVVTGFFAQCMHLHCLTFTVIRSKSYTIPVCSGITRGRVINGELYAKRLQKLIYLHLFTDCFMKIYLQVADDWREIFMK